MAPRGIPSEISCLNSDYVPCLFLPCNVGSSDKLVLFFHGNGEDLGVIYALLDRLRTELSLNFLAVEYPAYGVYEDK